MEPLPPAGVAGTSGWLSPDQLESDDYEALPDFVSVVEAAQAAGVTLALQPLAFFQGSVWLLRIVPSGATSTLARRAAISF